MKMLLLSLCAFSLVLAADNRYREDFHYTYPQTAGGRITLENFNGSVEITGWDQNTVDVSGTKYAETRDLLNAIQIEVTSGGNMVRIRSVHPHVEHGNMGAKYVVRVPRRTELEEVHSSNGSLRVQDIEGDARLATSNGSIRIMGVRGNVDAHSSNGGVEVNEVRGRMSFHTSNASVHADSVEGALEAKTSNGSVHVHLRDAESGYPIKVETSNGGIDLQMDSTRGNDVIASTSNGTITVRLPAIANATVSASTNSGGSVRSDFGILTHGELSRHRIEGSIGGGGGAKIDLHTSNGNVNLLKI